MDITFLGHSTFKLKGKTSTLVTDPYDPDFVGIKYGKVEAEIVTISHSHPDHNFLNNIENNRKIIDGPGEYEVSGVSIIGFPTFHDDKEGAERGKNTIYVIEMDGIRFLHLGDLGHLLSDKILSEIGDIDVLFIPVGGFYTIDASLALEVTKDIEPTIIIPMHYKEPGLKEELAAKLAPVESFITLSGQKNEKLPKLALKKDDMGEEKKIVILEKH